LKSSVLARAGAGRTSEKRYYIEVAHLSRRDLFKAALALTTGAAAGTLVHGYGWERHALGVTHIELPIAGLPEPLDGIRVGFLTDLHHSAIVPPEDIRGAVELLNRERPDLVVLGGDYVSFAERAYAGPVAEMLSDLRSPHGTFGIIGNHDEDRVIPAELRRAGVTMLLDARTSIAIRGQRLELAGLRFWTQSLRKIAAVVAGARDPVLMLAHDPRRIIEASELKVPAMLAGHTHGGQIVLPLIGAVAARKFPVAQGRFSRSTTEMFVSRGIGTVIVPIRVNCPPEIAVATLRTAAPSANA
jgi:predicted MPP superfamily phosphohydrolase